MNNNLFSVEPETALLSIILNNPSLIYNVTRVKFFMFNSIPNQFLFSAIDDLNLQNLVPDQHLLVSTLDTAGRLDKVGGKEYVEYLVKQSFDSSNILEYEKMIIDSYKARVLISLSSKVPNMITSANIDEVINQVKQSIENLSLHSGGETTVQISDILSSTFDEIKSRVENPGPKGFTTGISDIDMVTSAINPGDLWFVGGRPGSGKSALLCNSVKESAKKGVRSLIFSLEMNKQSIVERLLAIDSGIPLMPNIRMGMLSNEQMKQISDILKGFKDLPIHIDTNFIPNLEYIESTIRKYKKNQDINLVWIDYIGLLVERDENATQELGRISRKLKLLANELGIGIIVFSQLNRGVESREDKRPVMSDLRQSGNLEEDADLMAGLYREEYYDKDTPNKGIMEFIIRKQRSGPVGTIFLGFDAETNRIYNK